MMYLYLLLTYLIIFSFSSLYILNRLFLKYINNPVTNRYLLMDKIPEIIYILDSSKKIAFEKIYREDIMVYTASKEIISKKDLEKPLQNFVKLTLTLCGPSIVDDLILLYGDSKSVASLLGNEFINMVSERESFRNMEYIQTGLNNKPDNVN